MTDPSFLLGQNTTDGINQYGGSNNGLTLTVVIVIVISGVLNAIASVMQAVGLWLFKYKKLKWAKEEKALDLEAGPSPAPTITVNVNTPPASRNGSPHHHRRHHSDEELHRRTIGGGSHVG